MTDERYTFEQTKVRLEEILVHVKKKDTSLENSLELLEEGVRLANQCNELIDQTSWRSAEPADGDDPERSEADAADRLGATVAAGPEAGVDAPTDDPAEAETLPDDERE